MFPGVWVEDIEGAEGEDMVTIQGGSRVVNQEQHAEKETTK